jgi:hypothetical protein
MMLPHELAGSRGPAAQNGYGTLGADPPRKLTCLTGS